ncbi:Prolyl endopeptidase [Kordia antarctica]|uniref:prolyl oligopeptidase n=1 Tax=Kordia antarctica TaxID=1218801 RepID=A0A7L4ZG93_9FLAO|nr:prolyl oligopeptidase family serine peptidase [Kordia antarctica]QHI35768.1 Prolyl endopeptidase [Kordia antarctica]
MRKVFIYAITIFIIYGIKKNKENIFQYPKISKVDSINNYWGKVVNDSYRNLENSKDSVVQNWYNKQGLYTENVINNISNRDSLASFLSNIDNRRSFHIGSLIITENDFYFYLKIKKDEKRRKLYFKKGFDGEEILLFDPTDFKPETKNDYVINYINPSRNAAYIVISLTYEGREYSEAIIYDVKTKKVLPQVIDHCWLDSFYGVDWLADNTGFTYLHFPNLYDKGKKSKSNTEAVLYKIGQDPKKLNVILSAKNNPKLKLDTINYPIVDIKSSSSKYLFAYMVNVGNYFDSYYADIDELGKGKINWKPLFKKEDKSYKTNGIIIGDSLYYRTAQNASNLKINVLNLVTKTTTTLVEESETEVIKDFEISKDGLFYGTLRNGVQAKLYKVGNEVKSEIKLPRASGSIGITSYDRNSNKLIVSLNGWVNSSQRFEYNTTTNDFKLKDLKPKGKYPEFEDFVVKEIEVPSHDGVLVPLSIIHHKDIELNGKNPVFMDGYGAYGDDMSPYFSPVTLAWVAKGGIYCTAHVRGGGEKGDAWHKAGMKTTKPNTWKDLIACMEYLVDNGYTSKEHNAIWSSSAGGILVGRAMTERPDLFKVVISEAGKMNPLRSEESSNGTNFKEYGTIKDSIECLGLIEMDSYLNIKDKTDYPATLVTAGMNDPRVAPWQSGKFVARLQEANTSNNPILFAIYKDSGHGSGTTIEQVYQEWANVYAFAFWQTGHPDFKLDEKALKKTKDK